MLRLAAILGRQRNIFTFSDGSQYSRWSWRLIFRQHIEAAQLQMVQTAPDFIELRYVPRDGADAPDAAAIQQIGRQANTPNDTARTGRSPRSSAIHPERSRTASRWSDQPGLEGLTRGVRSGAVTRKSGVGENSIAFGHRRACHAIAGSAGPSMAKPDGRAYHRCNAGF